MMSETDNTNVMTQAEFARRRGVSRATVTEYKQKGLLVMTDDGRVDASASEERLSASLDPSRGGDRTGVKKKPSAPQKGADGRFMAARTEELEAKAARQRMLLEKEAGRLVEKELVQHAAFTLARAAQEALVAIPDRLASVLAAEADAGQVHKLLSEEIRRVCNELSKGAEELFE